MSEEKEKAAEAQEFSSFASTALRTPRKGTYEQLLCQHLVMAVTSKPLKKIRLVCEAAMMADGSKDLNIDMELVETLNKIAISFKRTNHWKWYTVCYCSIPWAFTQTEENFKRFIEPWLRGAIRYYAYLSHPNEWPPDAEKERQKRREYMRSLREKEGYWRYFFEATGAHLADVSYHMMLGQFTSWALPQIMKMLAQLSKLVQPSLYREMFAVMSKSGKIEDEAGLGPRP